MDTNELIHKIEKARTKDDLEALGIEHLNVDVDKRKAKEVLRAELLGEAEGRLASSEAPATEPASTTEKPAKRDSTTKMARNKKTGRIIPWTAAMAKFSHMEQI